MSFWKRNFWLKRRHPTLKNEEKYVIGHDVEFKATVPGNLTSTRLTYEKHQPRHSLITLLPELFHLILDYCDALSVLCLRYSKRSLREIIPAPLSSPLEKNIFWSLLKKDRFYKFCALEEAGKRIQPNSVALCMNCHKGHSLNLFSAAQLATVSRRRVCVGIESRLTICKHATIGFNMVKFAAAGHPGEEACTDLHGSVPPLGPSLKVEWMQNPGGQFGLRSEHYIDHWEDLDVPQISQLMKSFATEVRNVQICPHTRGRDVVSAAFFKEVDGGFARLRGHAFICRNVHCHTTVTVVQRHGTLRTGSEPLIFALVMEVRRSLGALRTPTDTKWLAQIGCDVPPLSRPRSDALSRGSQSTSARVQLSLWEAV